MRHWFAEVWGKNRTYLLISFLGFFKHVYTSLRNDKNVNWSLRADISESQTELIFIDNVSWDRAVNNLIKYSGLLRWRGCSVLGPAYFIAVRPQCLTIPWTLLEAYNINWLVSHDCLNYVQLYMIHLQYWTHQYTWHACPSF